MSWRSRAASICRWSATAFARSTSKAGGSSSRRGSRREDRRVHARPARVRLDDRAAPGRGGARRRARAAPAQLPRLDAAARRSGRRRALRRRRRDGAARRHRRGPLDAVYGGQPDHRVVALTPSGRPLTQAVVEELSTEEKITLLSARFEGFDERVVQHLATDSISIGPYV